MSLDSVSKEKENLKDKLSYLLSEQIIEILKNLEVGVYVVSPERKILFWNDKAQEITGYSAEEVIGTHCQDDLLKHVDEKGTELCLNNCPLVETIKDGQIRKAIVFLRHKFGYRLPVRIKTLPILVDGDIKGAIEFFQENTEELNLLEELREARERTLICPLTEIGNRRYIELALTHRLAEAERLGSRLGVLFIDIDDFKRVNDTYGHLIGDIVLQMVARTLVKIIRPYDFVGRWGGEEMVVVAPHVNQEELYALGERIRNLISASSIKTTHGYLGVTVSVGATLSCDDDTVNSIIERADQMMYESKRNGKNQVTIYPISK
ncbi:MAG TPA: sensor domain-containing diguanylate cyclase [Candidatus Hydrogenedens sp.]|nr:sensor domain-containing diguanylate cyclase [Candidatus Hydrogenedens sp.]